MTTHKKDVEVLRQAFHDGANMLRHTLSVEGDPDLANYKKLTTEDFNDVANKFGYEATIDYVKEMETRALGVKKNARV